MLEGLGVNPHIEIGFKPEGDFQKRDDNPQILAAINVLR
jgi:hypothetical protein